MVGRKKTNANSCVGTVAKYRLVVWFKLKPLHKDNKGAHTHGGSRGHRHGLSKSG